jgi:outer membrane protein
VAKENDGGSQAVRNRKSFLSGLAALFLWGLSAGGQALGTDTDILTPVGGSYAPTSKEEVEAANPIKLSVTKESPPSEFPVISGQLGMDDAVQAGVKNNLALQVSQNSWLISKFQARSELGKFGPVVTANPFYATSSLEQMLFVQTDAVAHPPMQPVTRGTAFYQLFAGAMPIDTSGRILHGYKAARAVERQTLAGYRADRIATALKVKETYLEAAFDEARLQVASDYLKYRQWVSTNMKARMDNGKVPRADYLREIAELAKARDQLNNVYRDYNTALIKLKVTLGVDPVSIIQLKDPLEYKETEHDINFYLAEAVKHRPEIDQVAEKVKEMQARRHVAISNLLPQVTVYGLGSLGSGNTPDVAGSVGGNWGGMISVLGSWTVFDSGIHINQIKAAGSAIKQAAVAKKDVKLKVYQDVWTGWINLDLARRNVELAKAQVVSAAEDQRLFQKRFEVGKAIALEAFDAAVKKFQAQLTLLEAIYQYRLSQARLTWASGSI